MQTVIPCKDTTFPLKYNYHGSFIASETDTMPPVITPRRQYDQRTTCFRQSIIRRIILTYFSILHLYDLTFHFSQSGEIATEKSVSESHIQTIGKYFTPHTDAEKTILHRKTVHIMARNAPYHAMIQAVSLADTDHFARRRKIHSVAL